MNDPSTSEVSRPTSSEFRIHGLGKVAENKKPSSTTIMVVPIDKLTMLDGEIKSNPTVVESEGTDADGKPYVSSATVDNTYEADWLPFSGGYQMTAPDVRRGERVLLWRMADSEDIYWTPLGLDNDLRKLETVVTMLSATADESDTEQTADNSYCFTASSHEKILSLSTSKANGEPTSWAIQLNTGTGTLIVTEDDGHEISINVPEKQILLINADKSAVVIDKQDISFICDNDLDMTAANSVTVNTKRMNINAQQVNVKSEKVNVDTPEMIVTGKLTTGSEASIGGVTFSNGTMKCQGITSSGPVTAPNIR